ncbi:hybrid sensor histidine kinase/response regulator transcription factor [Pedobacter polysacchareus]|uniref:hybrid sensor histidine kinase/response regulator transcription factor n=1 Tax=Pedobacter polysacchareus TaxID=2861973 RepID=UPI001C99E3CE|nr:two-component regulator propeller domain-containing protein [Pedobacter polysacchareus]
MFNQLKSIAITVSLLWITLPSSAFDFSSVFYLGIENGLSNNEVNCIFQSRNGFMWFGTFDGLNRYDGYSFKIFRKKLKDGNSLLNNRVQCLAEDEVGNLWVGTMGGVSIYNEAKDSFTTLYFNPVSKSGTQRVDNTTVLKKEGNNDMLIGTAKDGLLLYTKETGKTIQIPLLSAGVSKRVSYQVTAIERDRNNQVWLFIEGVGLCRYDRKTQAVAVLDKTLKYASCIKADRSGNLWLGTSSGIYNYIVSAGKFSYKTLPRAVTSLYLDNPEHLYITTDGGGIFMMNIKYQKISQPLKGNGEEIFTSSAIKGMLKDRQGRVWVATLRGGINIIDDQRYRFKTLNPGPSEKNSYHNYFISSFAEDAARHIWIGTDGNGLNRWDRTRNLYVNYKKEGRNGLSSNNITTILNDQQNTIWVATWGGGINRFNSSKGTFEHFSCIHPVNGLEFKNIWNLYEDKQHNLWASTFDNGGLYRFNPGLKRFELFDDAIGNILCFMEDRKGNLWAGTDSKLIRIDKGLKRHLVYHIGHRVRAILEDKGDLFWLGTEGGGLLSLNTSSRKYRRFTESDGLPNNAVLNILSDQEGSLWLSTFYGLSKFNPTTKKFHNFFASDGLQSNQFSYLAAAKLKSGELIFGGIKGFNVFSAEKISFSRDKQQILLTEVSIDNKPVSDSLNTDFVKKNAAGLIDELVVPYHKASLSFGFISLEYSKPDKINYAYFLEGWDNNWINAGKVRTANYSRLKEGRYTFHIKASNSEGEWGDEKLVSIVVLPPWQRTWWAYSLYALVTGLGVYLYVRYKRQQLDLNYKVRLAQMETEKEKELNEKKLSFFTNITHELRTPLTLIVNPVKELMAKTEDALKQELTVIYRNASRLLTLVDQLMLFRTTDQETMKVQLSELNLYQLCKDTFESYQKIALSKHIHYEFECANHDLMIFGDYEKLEIIFFNLLSNAFKFTPPNGSILFKVEENEAEVRIFINDTGCGINENVKNKLFEKYYQEKNNSNNKEIGFGIGLYLAKQFIDCHQGELSYSSEPGTGTSFQIKLKKGMWFDPATRAAAQPENKVLQRPEQIPAEEITEVPNINTLEVTEKRSLLIVDDNMELRQYLKKIFSRQFVVYEAENGLSGFELAQKQLPDLVISDVLMEEGNGVELCKKIKTDPMLNHIPVILLSGLSSAESKLKGIESGADDYIIKPFDKDLLLAKINAVLDNRDTLHQYFRDNITLRNNNQKISATYKAFLEKCIAIVEENLSNEDFNAQWLARSCNLSYSILYKKVKSISGLSLNAFIRSIRLRKAALLMLSTNTNVNEAAFQVGIYDIKFFRLQFKKLYGMNPSDYIKKYRNSFSKEFNLIK